MKIHLTFSTPCISSGVSYLFHFHCVCHKCFDLLKDHHAKILLYLPAVLISSTILNGRAGRLVIEWGTI